MRFLLDENIPLETKTVLKRTGHDVSHVSDTRLRGKSDDRVLDFAKKEGRVLITLDLDFANIINYPPNSHSGVVVIRLNGPNRKRITEAIDRFVKSIKENELEKSLIILEESDYRIRR